MTHTAYFLQNGSGSPIRFVLGKACPCSSLSLATFFPDLATAAGAAHAHCNGDTQIMECSMIIKKLCDAVPTLDCQK